MQNKNQQSKQLTGLTEKRPLNSLYNNSGACNVSYIHYSHSAGSSRGFLGDLARLAAAVEMQTRITKAKNVIFILKKQTKTTV